MTESFINGGERFSNMNITFRYNPYYTLNDSLKNGGFNPVLGQKATN